ncbi:hypothetical protein DPMN_158037 [Dreissena polymorpha]|uniref:Uncharacterized protein n=1 Tax=Dreissena polymorpha TaxID=45954 RepID=A0A9D4ELQ7_DREPO|nr:hypothetical protein DPMN_158037 [Dreissena polymorpha]
MVCTQRSQNVRHIESEISIGLTQIVTFGTETVQTAQLRDVLMAIVHDEHIYGSYHAGEIMLKIKLGLWKRHIKYSAVVVFFNNDEHNPDVEIDKDSMALRVDLEEIHCTLSFCPLIWSNWLKLNLNVKGFFTAYVVLDPAQNLDPNIIKKCSGAVCVTGCPPRCLKLLTL